MNYEQFRQTYPIPLNAQQEEAVRAAEGPVLLLAVPGSGKTTVLVARLGCMVLVLGVPPESILTMTYTVSATADMRARFASFFGSELAGRMEFRTINGVCARIIRLYERMSGGQAFELCTDEKLLTALITDIYRRVTEEYPTESDIKTVRTAISLVKNAMLTADEIEEKYRRELPYLPELLREYDNALRARRLMDYDDQMVYALRILQKYPELLAEMQRRYRYFCVDEAQDTSRIQHAIIRLLSQGSDSLFMVGDEDQSIYGFRAAWPEALLHFEKDYAPATVLKMEENFRSGKKIVDLAQRFVEKSKDRFPKTLRAYREEEAVLQLIPVMWRRNQYVHLLQIARDCARDTAVLYRNNDSALPLIDLLERESIPYRCRAADGMFFTHRIVLDVCDILRLALDERDGECFLRVYYKLGRFITRDSAYAAAKNAKKSGKSVLQELAGLKDAPDYVTNAALELQAQFKTLRSDTGSTLIERVWRAVGYGNYVEQRQMDEEKYAILLMLAERTEGIEDFLQRLTELRSRIANHRNDPKVPFLLSTIHSSKGLEYDRVYLLDVHDGILPGISSADALTEEDRKTASEERRLLYVAMTRAKNELCFFQYTDRPQSFLRELRPYLMGGKSPAPVTVALPRVGDALVHTYFGHGKVEAFNGESVFLRFADGSVRGFLWEYAVEKALLRKE